MSQDKPDLVVVAGVVMVFVVVAMLGFVCGYAVCESQGVNASPPPSAVAQLRLGMTQEEVQEILGKPAETEFVTTPRGQTVSWSYGRYDLSLSFEDGCLDYVRASVPVQVQEDKP